MVRPLRRGRTPLTPLIQDADGMFGDASSIAYDGSGSGLDAGNVQDAIDEIIDEAGGATFDELGWFNVKDPDYGALGDNSTDDTVAIQAAIDAAHAAGGGTVYFPPGTYIIDGALRDTGTFNSQLEIPDSATFRQIRLLGAGKYLSVLRSTWDGSISGTPAIISCGTHDSTTQNAMYLALESLSIRGIDDPKLTAVDATKAITVRFDELLIATTGWPPSSPTHTNAVGLDCPWGLNDGHSGGTLLQVEGYYTGVRPSEQFSATAIWAAYCARVAEFRGQQGTPAFLRHACRIGRIEGYFSIRGAVFSGDQRWVWIDQLCMEHGDPGMTTVYDIDDASNYARGFIGWHTTDYSTGVEDNLLVNGGTGLSLFGAAAKRWKLNSVVDIPTGTDPSSNPANGFRLYAASATGKPTTRNSAGTVTTLMREGDAAGGGLAGNFPNPSVVNDGHSHTAATVAVDAEDVGYDNATSGLAATDVQAAIDEVVAGASAAGLVPVDTGGVAYDTSTPGELGITVTSDWGVDGGVAYYDDGGAATGEEAALFWDPATGQYTVVPFDFP